MNFNLTIKFMGFLKVLDFCELVNDLPVDGGPPHLTLVEAPHHTDVGLHDSWCDRGTQRVSWQKFFVSFTDLHVCHFDLQIPYSVKVIDERSVRIKSQNCIQICTVKKYYLELNTKSCKTKKIHGEIQNSNERGKILIKKQWFGLPTYFDISMIF